jgi:Ca2+-binding EF-hand superfamily protein
MKSSVLFAAGFCLALAATATAQQRNNMRFQAMDTNGDGVITRDEWRGNERSFREHDWNGDGRLSDDEVRPGAQRREREVRFATMDANRDGRITRNEWRGSDAVFNALDVNGNGELTQNEAIGTRNGAIGTSGAQDEFARVDVNGDGLITRSEWQWNQTAFDRLDTNHDRRLTRQEWDNTAAPPSPVQGESNAYRAGYERGRQEGIQAGREDKPRHWDLEGQRELEQADSGYQSSMGPRTEYQNGYRAGFRRGYREGFGRN